MIPRLVSAALLLPVAVIAVIYLPSFLFLNLVEVVLILAWLEFTGLASRYGSSLSWVTLLLLLVFPWVWTYREPLVLSYLVLSVFLILISRVFQLSETHSELDSSSLNLFAFLYLGIPLSLAGRLQSSDHVQLLIVLVAVWSGDSAAYFVGKAWGRHKITPRISPKKSLEGYVAGLVGSSIGTLLFARAFLDAASPQLFLALGLLLGLVGTLGDLFESILKRGADVKDTSNFIPGHGGVLDRLDSVLFALPAYYVWASLIE
ncbi:MAG: phosphatidate cytidylyltransferase [Acidobacteria bacterium]|nr:phosphatidate cytidylyltransferase [Acidobacteriota bacterium]